MKHSFNSLRYITFFMCQSLGQMWFGYVRFMYSITNTLYLNPFHGDNLWSLTWWTIIEWTQQLGRLHFSAHNKPAKHKPNTLGREMSLLLSCQLAASPRHSLISLNGISIRVLSWPALPYFLLGVLTACITLWDVAPALQAVSLLSRPSQAHAGGL